MHKDGKQLAGKPEKQHREFPETDDSSITPFYTWRASVCKTPPKGNGNVTAPDDARTASGNPVFFWEKKNSYPVETEFPDVPIAIPDGQADLCKTRANRLRPDWLISPSRPATSFP